MCIYIYTWVPKKQILTFKSWKNKQTGVKVDTVDTLHRNLILVFVYSNNIIYIYTHTLNSTNPQFLVGCIPIISQYLPITITVPHNAWKNWCLNSLFLGKIWATLDLPTEWSEWARFVFRPWHVGKGLQSSGRRPGGQGKQIAAKHRIQSGGCTG